jgi:hypothetical protein
MKDDLCYSTGEESLPNSVYLKTKSLQIYRGSPSEIILEMVPAAPNLTVRRALEQLVEQLALKRNLHVEMPWDAPDEILSNLLLQVMLDNNIIGPTPLS